MTEFLLDDLTATASSKHVIFKFLIVTLDPAGSTPSVFKGRIGMDRIGLSPTSILKRLSVLLKNKIIIY
jgi:hypothetical protein